MNTDLEVRIIRDGKLTRGLGGTFFLFELGVAQIEKWQLKDEENGDTFCCEGHSIDLSQR